RMNLILGAIIVKFPDLHVIQPRPGVDVVRVEKTSIDRKHGSPIDWSIIESENARRRRRRFRDQIHIAQYFGNRAVVRLLSYHAKFDEIAYWAGYVQEGIHQDDAGAQRIARKVDHYVDPLGGKHLDKRTRNRP